MERIGIRELRQHASRYLGRVTAGETLEVTDREQLVALLVPPGRSRTPRDRLVADGRLRPALAAWELPVPVQAERSTEDVLAELRAG